MKAVEGTKTQEEKARIFSARLEKWFRSNGRDFPWRESQNLFHLLVAELLLRKTQADRVLPVYNEFTARYRKPSDVLNARPEYLRELLCGLGLRQRVQWLVGLCKQLVEQHNGDVPSDYGELCRMKGIGPYTANMVLCLGRGETRPAIDNNIARLVSRVFDVKRAGDTRREKHIGQVLENVFHQGNPRLITLAMLDLAGMICRASKPGCTLCPLQDICSWGLNTSDSSRTTRRSARYVYHL